jgi:ApbE superfamily uncharacterized protein (UPF0280 family)
MYERRFYRRWVTNKDLIPCHITVKQTDLYILARSDIRDKAMKSTLKHRSTIEKYIQKHPLFVTTLKPYPADEQAPVLIKEMIKASTMVDVGPMAAVAGAIAEAVGKDMLLFSPEIIIENGGDDFLRTTKKRLVGIYAGDSSLSGRIALEIQPWETPLGICTSSATVGHSLSLGNADAVVVLSHSTSFADAAATAICNIVKNPEDIPKAIESAQQMSNLYGLVIIKGDQLGFWGKVKIHST